MTTTWHSVTFTSCIRSHESAYFIHSIVSASLCVMTIVLGAHKFSLQVTIDHHGRLYILAIIVPLSTVAKALYGDDSKTTEFEMISTKKLLHCSNASIDYVMGFGLEQEGLSLIAPIALACPLHLLAAGRGISTETCGLDEICFLLMTLVLVHNSIYYYVHIIL